PARLDGIRRACGAGSRAGLRRIALVGRRAAHGARVAGWMRAGRVAAGADVPRADVPVVRARGPVRLEGIGGAGRARARARLRDVALIGRAPADRAGVPRGVRAGGAAAATDVPRTDVPVVGAGRTVRLEAVGGAG